MAGSYRPIQHLLEEVDDYAVVIGLKDRIKDRLRAAYAIGFFHGGDDEEGGEGGVHEPHGSGPDSPALAAAGVPGATG